jgi:hypothetical protein
VPEKDPTLAGMDSHGENIHTVGEGILVVEAWIPEQTLAESAKIFNSGRYRYLVVVGG